VKLWEEAAVGKTATVQALEEKAEKVKGKKVQVEEGAAENSDWEDETDDEDGSEDDDETNEAPMLIDTQQKPHTEEPEVDEDGFTMVKSKGRSHR